MKSPSQTASKPNVIWIFGDQHRAQALGCSGDANLNTPNIDTLAATGVRFTNAIAGAPLCCPFRGSLLTGRYPHKVVPGHERQLPQEQSTIAHAFNDAGYDTAYFGKWHLDGFITSPEKRSAFHIVPPERRGGFRHWVGYENNNSPWDSWVHGGEGENAFHYRLPGYETDELTNLLLDYVDQQVHGSENGDAQPFFAVLSVQPPHDPYVAPEPFQSQHSHAHIQLRPNVPAIPSVMNQARTDLAGYYAMIENLDWNVGRIMTTLRDSGLFDNTHIVFFSDHGDMHGSHGLFRKTSPWEESIRIPFIISGERSFYHRHTGVTDAMLNHVDIAPTTLGLCGIDKPEWMEGTDFSSKRLPYRATDSEPDSVYMQSVVPTGDWHSVDKPWRGIVTKDGWKYVCFEDVPWLMFNLQDDPYEQMNLAHEPYYSEQRKKLNNRLRQWIIETEDTFSLPIYE